MQILFGADTPDDMGAGSFTHAEHPGNVFHYALDFNSISNSDVTIKDSIGRYVPIYIDHIPAMIDALMAVLQAQSMLNDYSVIAEEVQSETFSVAVV